MIRSHYTRQYIRAMFYQQLHLHFNRSTPYEDFYDIAAYIKCSPSKSSSNQGTQSLMKIFFVITHLPNQIGQYKLPGESMQHEYGAHVRALKHILRIAY